MFHSERLLTHHRLMFFSNVPLMQRLITGERAGSIVSLRTFTFMSVLCNASMFSRERYDNNVLDWERFNIPNARGWGQTLPEEHLNLYQVEMFSV